MGATARIRGSYARRLVNADNSRSSRCYGPASIDRVVGESRERLGYLQPQSLSGLEVQDKFQNGWASYRQIRWFRAFQDAVHEVGDSTIGLLSVARDHVPA
jgi:hypothetical protein